MYSYAWCSLAYTPITPTTITPHNHHTTQSSHSQGDLPQRTPRMLRVHIHQAGMHSRSSRLKLSRDDLVVKVKAVGKNTLNTPTSPKFQTHPSKTPSPCVYMMTMCVHRPMYTYRCIPCNHTPLCTPLCTYTSLHTSLHTSLQPYTWYTPQVTVAGADNDAAVFRSRVHTNTLIADIQETFTTPIHYPETALLLFQLKDKDPRKSDVLGYGGMSVSTLRCGTFVLPLAEPGSGEVTRDHVGRPKKWMTVDLGWVECSSDGGG